MSVTCPNCYLLHSDGSVCPPRATGTAWFLLWIDDPIGLAGTGRRVGTLEEARARVDARYRGAAHSGPFYGGTAWAHAGTAPVALLREFHTDFVDRPDHVRLAARVDAVREGRMTRAEYDAGIGGAE